MLRVINPYNDALVAELKIFNETEVHAAISRAGDMRPRLKKMPAIRRANILRKTADLIEKRVDELVATIVVESGKPLRYAKGEVSRATETFNFAADEARRLHGETIPMNAAKGGIGKIGFYIREPVGIIGAITPFNFPLNLVAHKIAPAIAAGCPIVLKPAPATPLTALKLQEIMLEAGLPEGAFEVVIGDADVGVWLTTNPQIAMLSFTGSPAVARKITQVAGLRRVALELGGNAATVVHLDADLERAVDRCIMGSFAYSGQVCISVQRIYIHENIYADFRRQFLERVSRLKLGDPANADTEIGPMISDTAIVRIRAWLAEASEQGAKIHHHGQPYNRIMEPIIVEDVNHDMKIMCEEIFGPVVNLIPYTDFESALDEVNNSPFGLQTGVFTSHFPHILTAINKLEVGGVIINDVPTFRVDHMPYGGIKDSGVGREGPRFAIEEMTEIKMIVMNP